MRRSKKVKILALLMVAVLLFSNNIAYSNAAGKCTHGGENFTWETHTEQTVSLVGCSEAAPHVIYVMGQKALCRVWHYKYMRTYRCKTCYATLKQECFFNNEVHEYDHN